MNADLISNISQIIPKPQKINAE